MKPVAEGSRGSEQGVAEGSRGSEPATSRPPPSPPREDEDAARGFLSFAQAWKFFGEHYWSDRDDLPDKPIGIWSMYIWHCREENTTPLPANKFAAALKKLVPHRQLSDCSTGKQRRWMVYCIPEAKTLERYWRDHGDDWNAEDGRPH